MTDFPLAFLGSIGTLEWVIIGVIALLLFGRRLPDVARSLGKSFQEFKRGLADPAEPTEPAHPKEEFPTKPESEKKPPYDR